MHVLKAIVEAFAAVLEWGWQIIVAFWSYLGIGEWLTKNILALLIIGVLVCGPFVVSKSDKNLAKKIASFIVDVLNHFRK